MLIFTNCTCDHLTMSQYCTKPDGIVQRSPFNVMSYLRLQVWVSSSQYNKVHFMTVQIYGVTELCPGRLYFSFIVILRSRLYRPSKTLCDHYPNFYMLTSSHRTSDMSCYVMTVYQSMFMFSTKYCWSFFIYNVTELLNHFIM